MRHNTSTIMDAFVNGAKTGDTRTIHIVGDDLKSYATPVAERLADGFALTTRKFSVTTSCQMTALRRALTNAGFVATDETIDYGATNHRSLWPAKDGIWTIWRKA